MRTLSSFDEKLKRYRDYEYHFRSSETGDGTWRVSEYCPELDREFGNWEHFPTKEEADWYTNARNDGSLHLGALMRVLAKRVAKARTDFKTQIDETSETWQDGYRAGWQEGYEEGNADGWDEGYSKGLEEGEELE